METIPFHYQFLLRSYFVAECKGGCRSCGHVLVHVVCEIPRKLTRAYRLLNMPVIEKVAITFRNNTQLSITQERGIVIASSFQNILDSFCHCLQQEITMVDRECIV